MYPTGSQIRAARALLGLSVGELADRAHVSSRTVQNLEADATKPNRVTQEAVMGVLIAEGIRFVPADEDTGRGIGVMLDR
jgi:DNA-binding transcriptional regulator YiaG